MLAETSTTYVYFRQQPHSAVKAVPRCWNIISILRTVLGPDICENILFVHAISGCDTTYALYSVKTALKLVNTNKIFLEQAKVFSTHGIMADGVVAAREDKRHWLYKGQPGDSLNILRLHQFHHTAGKSKSLVQPEVLPPSSSSAKYHSL